MKYYCRGTQQESICEHTNEGVKIIYKWNNCPPDAVFNFYAEEFPWVTHPMSQHFLFSGLPYKIGDRVKNVFPWEVRIVSSFSFDRQSYLVVRSDAFPLIWIWRSFQWWLENPVRWWLFQCLDDIGILEREPDEAPHSTCRFRQDVLQWGEATSPPRTLECGASPSIQQESDRVLVNRDESGNCTWAIPSLNGWQQALSGGNLQTERNALAAGTRTSSGERRVQWIGDANCKYNARSPFLRCAVNPTGDCENCQHFEKRL